MMFPVVAALVAEGLPVAACCRVLHVSRSGFYEWRDRPPSPRDVADAELIEQIKQIHAMSRGTYGSPRVHAELRLGRSFRCGRKRVERLMRQANLEGTHRRKRVGCTKRNPAATPSDDLVNRGFTAEHPNQLWISDITQHPTDEGWLYCAVTLDAFSRRVIGWSIADHLRTELVVDALQMALWRRRDVTGCVHHSDHGCQYTSWAFGQRLRAAGLLGSMGSVGDALDNAACESFFASMQTELLDRRKWTTRAELANAIFDWIEGWYNPYRRHSTLGYLSPNDYEHRHTDNTPASPQET